MLTEYQEREDEPEKLACIPVLEREDIKKETERLYNEVRSIGERTCMYHPIFTNGIDYARVIFKVKAVPQEYFPYLGLLKSVLGYVATEHYSYAELFNQIHLNTGGMVPVVNVYTNSKDLDDITIQTLDEPQVISNKCENTERQKGKNAPQRAQEYREGRRSHQLFLQQHDGHHHRSAGQRHLLGVCRRHGLPRKQEVYPLRGSDRCRDGRQGCHGAWSEDGGSVRQGPRLGS